MAYIRKCRRLRSRALAFCLLTAGLLPIAARTQRIEAQQSDSGAPGATPDDFQQGLLAIKENRFAEAIEKLTAAKRGHPDNARIRNFLGIALAAVGKNSEAAAEYQEAIRLAPAMEDAYRNLGFVEWNQHQLEAAARDLTSAVELSPQDSFAHYYLGRVYLEAQSYPEAVEQLEKSRALWPDDAGFLIEAARGYAVIASTDEASKLLARVTKLQLAEVQTAQAASLLVQLRENATAIRLLENLIRSGPQPKSWARFDLALAELLAGEYDKAECDARLYTKDVSQASAQVTEAASAWSLVGIANARAGHAQESVDAFRRAAKLAPSQEENWLNLTRELMDLSRYADAISAVHDGLLANPKSYALHLRLGAAQMAAGHYAEAEAAFRNLVSAGDPLPTSYVGLAQVLLRLGRADEAAVELSAARQKLGATFLISYFLGLALQHAGKPSEALAAFEQAAQLDPASAEAHVGIGKTELTLGRVSEAIAELQKALHLSPRDVQARRLLSTAYRRAGDTQKAARYAQAGAAVQDTSPRDLIGDFFSPSWQWPRQDARN